MYNHKIVIEALYLKLNTNMLDCILASSIEKWDYFKQDNIIKIFNKLINNEISFSDFRKWSLLESKCIINYPNYFNEYKRNTYNIISSYFNDLSIMNKLDINYIENSIFNIIALYKKYIMYEKYSLEYEDELEKIYISS